MVNSIIYFVKSSDDRWGSKEINIFNDLMNLFDDNVHKNFIIGISYFSPLRKGEEPNFIKIFKNSCDKSSNNNENKDDTTKEAILFYYENILNREKISKNEIFNTFWYFALDNQIIIDDNIERNEMEKYIWKHTEEEIKKFIDNKLRVLSAVSVKESAEIIEIRNEIKKIKVENESLFLKFGELIRNAIVHKFNKDEMERYKINLETQYNLLKQHEDKKNEIMKEAEKNKNEFMLKLMSYEKKVIKKRKILSEFPNILCECQNIQLDNEDIKCNCNTCHTVCHYNCDCSLTGLTEWFCHNINFLGECKICGHSFNQHVKTNFIYETYEETEVIDKLGFLSESNDYNIIRKENESYIAMIDNVEESIKKYIKFLEDEMEETSYEKKIKNYEDELSSTEFKTMQVLEKIDKNLLKLKDKALQKKNTELKDYIKQISNKDNEQFFDDCLEKYKKLKQQNLDIENLTLEQYKKLFD